MWDLFDLGNALYLHYESPYGMFNTFNNFTLSNSSREIKTTQRINNAFFSKCFMNIVR